MKLVKRMFFLILLLCVSLKGVSATGLHRTFIFNDDLRVVSFTSGKKNKEFQAHCGESDNVPYQIRESVFDDQSFLFAYKRLFTNARRKFKNDPTAKRRRRRNTKRREYKAAEVACANFVDEEIPLTPPINPPGEGGEVGDGEECTDGNPFTNFDLCGNVNNPEGYDCFEIPNELEANLNIGLTIAENNCFGCHGFGFPSSFAEVNGRKFNYIRDAISASPMFFSEIEIPDEDLAHLTAYINRFNGNSCPPSEPAV